MIEIMFYLSVILHPTCNSICDGTLFQRINPGGFRTIIGGKNWRVWFVNSFWWHLIKNIGRVALISATVHAMMMIFDISYYEIYSYMTWPLFFKFFSCLFLTQEIWHFDYSKFCFKKWTYSVPSTGYTTDWIVKFSKYKINKQTALLIRLIIWVFIIFFAL